MFELEVAIKTKDRLATTVSISDYFDINTDGSDPDIRTARQRQTLLFAGFIDLTVTIVVYTITLQSGQVKQLVNRCCRCTNGDFQLIGIKTGNRWRIRIVRIWNSNFRRIVDSELAADALVGDDEQAVYIRDAEDRIFRITKR